MTMTIDQPHRGRRRRDDANSAASQRLRSAFAAARVSFTWLGVKKGLSADQKNQAAESFGAEGQYLTAAKKLLDTSHPAFQAVNSLRSRIQTYWREPSLPYPAAGGRRVPPPKPDKLNPPLHPVKA